MVLLYIDPGAGSMLIQAVLAGLLAVPFMFRAAIARGIHRFRGRSQSESIAGSSERASDD
jgi:hypothetical protein